MKEFLETKEVIGRLSLMLEEEDMKMGEAVVENKLLELLL